MKSETPTSEGDETALFQGQAVEFALILSRMITTVKEDPSQMRLAIYEFARARLKTDTSWANEAERKRLLASLYVKEHLPEMAPPGEPELRAYFEQHPDALRRRTRREVYTSKQP